MDTLVLKISWSRQYSQIRKEGFPAVWRKAKITLRTLVKLLFVFMAVPVVLVIRILKPVVWIRFGYILGARIGHFVFDVEYYLSERELGKQPKKAIDFFFYRWGKPANTFFSKMCERQVRVRSWAEFLFTANHWLPGGHDHEVLPAVTRSGSRDLKGLFQQIKPQLYFTDEENLQGEAFLKKIGCKKDEKFVCLIVRDSAYLSQYLGGGGTWSYHNYRDTDIDTYEEAVLALAEKGYWVFRMGKAVYKPLKTDHPRILDYANSTYRSDFMDIWLAANCFFCISTGTGLDEVPRVFRKPAVYVNYLPTQRFVTYDHCISVPKHLVWQDTNRRLTLSEHLVHSYGEFEKYQQEKILVQDLNPEEIRQAVLEMESRLTGIWKETEEDVQRQHRFWKVFKGNVEFHTHHGRIHPEARVSSSFLKANTQWLK
jgi:putative glycosyltransferase (TIGR04372 family)